MEASIEQNEREFVEQAKNRTADVWKDMQVQSINMVKNQSSFNLGEEKQISMKICANRTDTHMIMLDSGCSHRPVANDPLYLLE